MSYYLLQEDGGRLLTEDEAHYLIWERFHDPGTKSIAAYGTFLQYGTLPLGSTPQSYQLVGELRHMNGPTVEVGTVDVTTHASMLRGPWREFLPTVIDYGTLEVELNWVHADQTHQTIRNDLTTRTLREWRLIPPAARTGATARMDFRAYVTAMVSAFPLEEAVSAVMRLRITKVITMHYATA